MQNHLITVEDLQLSYPVNGGVIEVTRGFNWSVSSGRFHAIIGPSGCGKSTLLRAIAGLVQSTAGHVSIHFPDGKRPHDISLAFQTPTLLPWLTLEKNALIPFSIAGSGANSAVMDRFNELLNLVDLVKFRHAYPHQLSGGMQMRAALIRTFITESRLMLMDEPFSSLDELTRERLCAELELLWIRKGQPTVVFISHNIQEAIMLADSVTVFSERPFKRVGDDVMVPLPRPRTPDMRFSQEFADIMSKIRSKLDAGCTGSAAA